MMKLSISEIAKAVKATNDWRQWSDLSVESVEFDARKVSARGLFVPLEGGARDGHEFFRQAQNNGAVVSLWSETTKEVPPEDFPVLVVADTLVALQALSRFYLTKVGAKVIGITGSNGKTTTKDLVASVVSQKFSTYKTQGNYNNHIGLPYTILSMPLSTEVIVLEMGMDHFGEIDCLSQLATPDIAVITMIGESHLEHLGSRKGIAQAKMEIVAGLVTDGVLIVPGDEPLLTKLLEPVSQRIIYFGEGQKSQLVPQILTEGQALTSFVVEDAIDERYQLPLMGRYNVNNALIAIGIGRELGLSYAEISAGLAAPSITQSRTEWLVAPHGGRVLSDVYNANPTAMGLVLDTFSQLKSEGKKIAVLADMKELGPESRSMHERMATHLNPADIQYVLLLGDEMAALYEALLPIYGEDNVRHYRLEEKDKMAKNLSELFGPTDMVVLKGSNSMKLIETVEKVIEN